jgi:cytochrome c556
MASRKRLIWPNAAPVAHPMKNQKGFDAFAQALQAVALEALRAADSKDVPQLMDVGARMENVCESCHQAFWYPQEKRPN